MRLTLFDVSEALCEAWGESFADCEDVLVVHGRLENLGDHDAVVTPGNGFGVMTGGIDRAMRDLFGYGVQDAVQDVILAQAEPLAVGRTITVMTEGFRMGALIYAPTMRTPRMAENGDVFNATVAALDAAMLHGFETVAMPGMGTGVGQAEPKMAAWVMRVAYDTVLRLNGQDGKGDGDGA